MATRKKIPLINETAELNIDSGHTLDISGGDISLVGSGSNVITFPNKTGTLVVEDDVLKLDNTTSFTPDADYEPATKKYVDDNAYPSADATKVGFISVTQAVNLDTIESDTATNNAKVSYTDASAVSSNTSFRTTPSTIITAGTDLTWSGNTLNYSGSGGGGDVYKFGTGVNNQMVTWANDGYIQGESNITFDGSTLNITGNLTISGTVDGIDIATDVAANTAKTGVTDEISNVVEDTTPQLGGNLDRNSKAIIITATAGEAITPGRTCYLKSDGKYWKADASAEATASTDLLIANDSISANATGEFTEFGEFDVGSAVLTVGAKYYLSDATAGDITPTMPSSSGSIVRIVAQALTTRILKYKPDTSYVELS